jgi:hypothetical protein
MPTIFTSHEFILCLAQQHQTSYIDALSSYRGEAAPFRRVHGILARHLNAYHELVFRIGEVQSVDIFGEPSKCAQWRKL